MGHVWGLHRAGPQPTASTAITLHPQLPEPARRPGVWPRQVPDLKQGPSPGTGRALAPVPSGPWPQTTLAGSAFIMSLAAWREPSFCITPQS